LVVVSAIGVPSGKPTPGVPAALLVSRSTEMADGVLAAIVEGEASSRRISQLY